jgi:MFS family permease
MSRRLAPIFLTVFVDVLALTFMLPLLPHYAQTFGASPLQVGLLLASFSLCQLVSGPVLGRLSDRLGRKPVLVTSQVGTLIGLLVIGTAGNLTWLFVGRILDGLTAGNLSIAQAYITDETKPEERTKAYAFFGIAFGVGFLIGPALSGKLAILYGYAAPPLGAAGLSLLSIALSTTLLPNRKPPANLERASLLAAFRHILGQSAVRSRILELFGYVFSFALLTGGLALFLERRLRFDVEQVGYAFAFSGLVGLVVVGGVGRAAKRLGERRLSAIGLVLMTVGYVVLAFSYDLPTLGIALGIGGVGAAVVRPALTTLIAGSVPESERGLVLGVSQSASSLGQTLGPAVAGLVIGAGALRAWGLIAAGVAISTLGVRWLSSRIAV